MKKPTRGSAFFAGCSQRMLSVWWLRTTRRELRTLLDVLLGEPALVHFEHVAHRLQRAVRVLGHGLHVDQVHDAAIVRYESGSERQYRVAHPEALRGGLLEHEDHAFGLRHFLAEHQADFALLRRLRNLRIDLVEADRQLRAWQFGLGLLLLGLRRHHERCGQEEQGGETLEHRTTLSGWGRGQARTQI
jgi:hypothetical protein